MSIDVQLVSGEEIRKWFWRKNYHPRYDLGKLETSCMRYDTCQPYFNLYTRNPRVCQMIVVTQGFLWWRKLIGRSLVWTTTTGEKFYDIIYASGRTKEIVREFAKAHGIKSGIKLKKQYKVQLDYTPDVYFPYLDTFCYHYSDDNEAYLTNFQESCSQRLLQNTHGHYSRIRRGRMHDETLDRATFREMYFTMFGRYPTL